MLTVAIGTPRTSFRLLYSSSRSIVCDPAPWMNTMAATSL